MKTYRTTHFIKKYPFKVSNSYIILKLTDEKPEVIDKLHSINYKYDGICMEGLMAYSYKIDNSFYANELFNLNNCLSFIIDISVESFKQKHSEIKQIDIIAQSYKMDLELLKRIFLSRLDHPFVSIENNDISMHNISILFYISGYLLNHLTKNNEILDFEDFKKYITLLLNNIETVMEYINNIHKVIGDDNVRFGINIDFIKDDIHITGEADMITDDWLFDIKCSKENEDNLDSWHRQLEVYNNQINKNNIAIINILNNHFIIYGTKDEFKNYKIGSTDFDDLLD